jgi:hypothetical protein
MCVQCSHEHVRAFTVDNIFVDTISMEKSWLHLDQTGGHSISWGQVTAEKSSESRCRGIERLFARLLTLAWWWVVVTWVLTMVITVGIFGRYAFVEWRWYQEEASKNEIASKQDSAEGRIRGEKHGPVAVTDEATGTGCLPVLRVKLRWRRRPKTSQS